MKVRIKTDVCFTKHFIYSLIIFSVLIFIISSLNQANAIDWNRVEGKEITLFHTGQTSWEWCLTKSDHSAAKKFIKGKNCIECHRDEEKDIGSLIVSGKKHEPLIIKGRRAFINVNVKTAHDGNDFYLRLEWPESKNSPKNKMDPDNETKVSVMLDDGNVKEAKRAGCWGTCHDDSIGMANSFKNKKITKYLAISRTKVTRKGGGDNYKSRDELDKLLNKGIFVEYWSAGLNRGAKPHVVEGYILEERVENPDSLIEAQSINSPGKWIAVFKRKLKIKDKFHKDIVPNKTYTISFSIHDNYTNHRFHHVAFEHTLTLDQGNADFVAVKQ